MNIRFGLIRTGLGQKNQANMKHAPKVFVKMYIECPFRDPKACKNGGKCRFLNNYAYEHSNQIKKINNEEKTFNEKSKYLKKK